MVKSDDLRQVTIFHYENGKEKSSRNFEIIGKIRCWSKHDTSMDLSRYKQSDSVYVMLPKSGRAKKKTHETSRFRNSSKRLWRMTLNVHLQLLEKYLITLKILEVKNQDWKAETRSKTNKKIVCCIWIS